MADKSSVLLTAFKPWNGRPSNITGEIVTELGNSLKRLGVDTHVFDVSYKAVDEFTRNLDAEKYSHIVSLGIMRQNNPPIRFETRARKMAYKPDDKNLRPQFEQSAALLHHTSERLLSAKQNLRLFPYDIGISNDAGGFVCEYTLYCMLERALGTDTQAGFIHFSNADKENKKKFLLDYLNILSRD